MSARDEAETHWFVAPPLDGPVTGGTLYNRELVRALLEAGVRAVVVDPEVAERSLASGQGGSYWVDTLYLAELRRLAAARSAPAVLGLLVHYLPSLVERGSASAELEPDEHFALEHADACVAPSRFMRDVLALHRALPVGVVEPGRSATGLAESRAAEAPAFVSATLVANLLPGKGVDGFLEALGAEVARTDSFSLAVIGSETLDAACAARCRARVAEHPELAGRVRFEGAQPPELVLRRLAESDVVLSASRMESFGMALAEARTLGIPIVARRAGNTAELVSDQAGGELVSDDAALAAAYLRLVRDPDARERRRRAARAFALAPRSWEQAAHDFSEFTRQVALSAERNTPPGTIGRTTR